jgi:hypothetical protein
VVGISNANFKSGHFSIYLVIARRASNGLDSHKCRGVTFHKISNSKGFDDLRLAVSP